MAQCPKCFTEKPAAAPRCPNCTHRIDFFDELIWNWVVQPVLYFGLLYLLFGWLFK